MFEARILQGALLKKIIEAIRELVVDANFDCSDRGITMQVQYLIDCNKAVLNCFLGHGFFSRVSVCYCFEE